MKKVEVQQQRHYHRRLINRFTVFVFGNKFVFLFVFSFVLGFFSASSVNHYHAPPATNEATAVNYSDLLRFHTACADPVPAELVRQTVLDRLYNGTSPYDGFPPPHAAPLLRSRRVKGWGSTGAVFANLIRHVRPRTVVEVGTFLGASATHIAAVAASAGLRPQIVCVDDFRGWPGFREARFRDLAMVNADVVLLHQFMQNVVSMNMTNVIVPMPFSTSSALAKLCEWGVYADLLEIDAGHDFHSAWSDINMAYTLLRPGGVIFGHDYFTKADDHGVRRAVNLFAKVKGLSVQVDGQHWVIARPV